MAKGSRSGGGGSDESRKKGILNRVFEEASEIGLGVIAGQLSSAVLRELVRKWFTGRDGNEAATLDQITDVKKRAVEAAKEHSGDGKLAELYERFLSDVVSIHASSRSDVEKEVALRQALKDYRAAVNEVKLAALKSGLQQTLAKLTPAEAQAFMVWMTSKRLKLRGKRVFLFTPPAAASFMATGWPLITSLEFGGVVYRFSVAEAANFQRWLVANHPLPLTVDLIVDGAVIDGLINAYRLTKDQRNEVQFRKDQINDAELIRRMLACSDEATVRFDYLMGALPKKPIKDQVAGVVEAVLTGRAGSHPLVQSFARSARSNAADRIAAVERKQNDPARKRRNSL